MIPLNLRPAEQAALNEFGTWVRSRFKERLRELTLFASRARGEGNEESDLDVLVAVEELSSAEGREIGFAGPSPSTSNAMASGYDG